METRISERARGPVRGLVVAVRTRRRCMTDSVFGRDIVLVVALKVALIVALYLLLFRPALHPAQDPAATAAAVAGAAAATVPEVQQ